MDFFWLANTRTNTGFLWKWSGVKTLKSPEKTVSGTVQSLSYIKILLSIRIISRAQRLYARRSFIKGPSSRPSQCAGFGQPRPAELIPLSLQKLSRLKWAKEDLLIHTTFELHIKREESARNTDEKANVEVWAKSSRHMWARLFKGMK